jgi:hypothetical protein
MPRRKIHLAQITVLKKKHAKNSGLKGTKEWNEITADHEKNNGR